MNSTTLLCPSCVCIFLGRVALGLATALVQPQIRRAGLVHLRLPGILCVSALVANQCGLFMLERPALGVRASYILVVTNRESSQSTSILGAPGCPETRVVAPRFIP